MSRNANPLTSFTLLEDRLTALLARIDSAASVLTEQAVRESSAPNNSVDASGGDTLDQLRQLTELLERQESTAQVGEASQNEWLVPLQQQLERIEQRMEELGKPANSPATFS